MHKRTWDAITDDKKAARQKSAARPYAEKLAVLDKLINWEFALQNLG